MIPALLDADGSLVVDTTTPGAGVPFSGGFALSNTGALFVIDGTGTRFNGGHLTTDAGQLCIAPGGVTAGYVNGLPVTADGRLVTQLNQPVSPNDAWVGGIRVGPLGGVYTRDTAPVVLGGFSNGFSDGFEV